MHAWYSFADISDRLSVYGWTEMLKWEGEETMAWERLVISCVDEQAGLTTDQR